MIKKISIFILLPVLVTTLGEFLLKSTINSIHFDPSIVSYTDKLLLHFFPSTPFAAEIASHLRHFELISTHLGVLGAIACIIIGGLLWIVAMSKFELSFLYPFLSINYVLVIVGSQWLLGEAVSI